MWGLEALAKYILTWGARACFNSSNAEFRLNYDPNRKGWSEDSWADTVDPKLREAFWKFICDTVFPWTELASLQMMGSDKNTFVKRWDFGPDTAVVLRMCPNGSCGYMYMNVSLVRREDAPAEILPRDPVVKPKPVRQRRAKLSPPERQRGWY